MEGLIVHREGKVFVKFSEALATAPIRMHLYWGLDCQPSQVRVGLVASYQGSGIWTVPGPLGREYLRGLAVPPIKEEEKIEPPQVRPGVETRWNGTFGCWEKLLKRGWVLA